MAHTHTKAKARRRGRTTTCPKCRPNRRTQRRKATTMKDRTLFVLWLLTAGGGAGLFMARDPDLEPLEAAGVAAVLAAIAVGLLGYALDRKKSPASK